MIKKILDYYKKIDEKVHTILKHGLQFCLALCGISVLILLTYNLSGHSPFTYTIGIGLFKLSIIFAVEFVVCGFVTDGIKKQLI